MAHLKVLELFSGIGGMHLALKESKISAHVVGAVDINTSANEVYSFNFPETKLMQRNIEALPAKEIEALQPDMILMSPPCQPFTRYGKQQGLHDTRSMPLIHFMELIPHLWGVRYILLENVVGFESSIARQELVQILQENLFQIQEFHLSPSQFQIPNSRTRYYLLAKRKPWKFLYETCKLETELPANVDTNSSETEAWNKMMSSFNSKYVQLAKNTDGQCYTLSNILEQLSADEVTKHAVPDKLLDRYVWETDFVTPESTQSCCFTKAYRRYFLGTGSIIMQSCTQHQLFQVFEDFDTQQSGDNVVQLRALCPRFFTPREIMRLMCFPESYKFPPTINARQASSLLGNSVNVHVVTLLILYLTAGDLESS